MDQLKYLEEERLKLWDKVTEIEDQISKKASDSEKEAKQASRKASEFRNRSEESKDAAELNKIESFKLIEEIRSEKESLKKLSASIHRFHTSTKGSSESLISNLDSITIRKEALEEQIVQLEELYSGYAVLKDKINNVTELTTQGDDALSKINSVHRQIINRKNEIDELYYVIFGYHTDGEEGEEDEYVVGLKDQLQKSYNELDSSIKDLNEKVRQTEEQANSNYQSFIDAKNIEYEKTLEKWNRDYLKVKKNIDDLLPNALTAGLSHAYSEKKGIEEIESSKLITRFNIGITAMIFVSLIPFLIGIWQLNDGQTLVQVLLGLPRIAFSILPLYIPVLWLTYSANKKLNLSKRLIEEYTHKEVLSKTYEGLSKRINDIEDWEASEELRTRLLFNILEVSSENPGKLISDYNKSDHPIMDALDKSAKLANAVEKLASVPGLGKLSKILEKKRKEIIVEQNKNIERVLDEDEEETE